MPAQVSSWASQGLGSTYDKVKGAASEAADKVRTKPVAEAVSGSKLGALAGEAAESAVRAASRAKPHVQRASSRLAEAAGSVREVASEAADKVDRAINVVRSGSARAAVGSSPKGAAKEAAGEEL